MTFRTPQGSSPTQTWSPHEATPNKNSGALFSNFQVKDRRIVGQGLRLPKLRCGQEFLHSLESPLEKPRDRRRRLSQFLGNLVQLFLVYVPQLNGQPLGLGKLIQGGTDSAVVLQPNQMTRRRRLLRDRVNGWGFGTPAATASGVNQVSTVNRLQLLDELTDLISLKSLKGPAG